MRIALFVSLIFIPFCSFAQNEPILNTFSQAQLYEDFDLLTSAIEEAHAGLYWYNSRPQFDSLIASERAKLQDGTNSYEFFRIASKVVSATKEGHCRIGSSSDIGEYFNQKALIIPLSVKVLGQKLFLLNDVDGKALKGKILSKIEGVSIDEIIDCLFSLSPRHADGNIRTGKYRYSIDYTSFAYYYADYFDNKAFYEVEIQDPKTQKTSTMKLKAVSVQEYRDLTRPTMPKRFDEPINLQLYDQDKAAYLTLHSFRHTYYDKEGNEDLAFKNFKTQIDDVFAKIEHAKVQNLIIDLRNNGGGTEGYEDYVLSYLTNEAYSKYKYVEANALSYSFLSNTQFDTDEEKERFERDMSDEFSLAKDGRYLRKVGFMPVAAPQNKTFAGKVYVLISGKTYSGGSELAALLKGKTDAIFVGEETAGGYYGQTSGFGLRLTLPNTKIRVSIPLLKFVLDVPEKDIPFGRGVIPHYEVEPTFSDWVNEVDTELNFSLALIKKDK